MLLFPIAHNAYITMYAPDRKDGSHNRNLCKNNKQIEAGITKHEGNNHAG